MNDLLKIIIKCVEKSKRHVNVGFHDEDYESILGNAGHRWMDVIDADLFIEALKGEMTLPKPICMCGKKVDVQPIPPEVLEKLKNET